MNTIIKLLSIILIFGTLASCGDDTDEITLDPFAELTLIETVAVTDTDMTVKIFTGGKSALYVGYNAYQVGLFDADDNQITDADIMVMPMMDMGEMKHSAPHEHQTFTNSENELHSFSTVFQMPSSDMGKWSLDFTVKNNNNDAQGTVSVIVPITMPVEERMKSFDTASGKLFVSLVDDIAPEVGVNDFEITIHQKMSMMDWPAVENYTIEIVPEMPSMGHGSPNNVNPTHSQNGHYMGKVNYTMTGYWKVNVNIYDGEELIIETSFDITF